MDARYPFVVGICGMILAAILIISCSALIPHPTETDLLTLPQELSRYTLDELREGRRTYVESCGACHRLYNPRERTAREWLEVYKEMNKKIGLQKTDEGKLLAYLRAYAKASSDTSRSR